MRHDGFLLLWLFVMCASGCGAWWNFPVPTGGRTYLTNKYHYYNYEQPYKGTVYYVYKGTALTYASTYTRSSIYLLDRLLTHAAPELCGAQMAEVGEQLGILGVVGHLLLRPV